MLAALSQGSPDVTSPAEASVSHSVWRLIGKRLCGASDGEKSALGGAATVLSSRVDQHYFAAAWVALLA